jgi:hypothetical protein
VCAWCGHLAAAAAAAAAEAKAAAAKAAAVVVMDEADKDVKAPRRVH